MCLLFFIERQMISLYRLQQLALLSILADGITKQNNNQKQNKKKLYQTNKTTKQKLYFRH